MSTPLGRRVQVPHPSMGMKRLSRLAASWEARAVGIMLVGLTVMGYLHEAAPPY